MHTVAEDSNFLLCLQHGDFRCLDDTTLDVFQTAFFLFGVGFLLDDAADQFFNLRDKPYQNACIGQIETGVEGSKHKAQFGCIGQEGGTACGFLGHGDIVSYQSANHIDKGTEDDQNPADAEEVEEHVCKGGSAGLRTCREGYYIRGDRSTDVLTHYECNTLIDGQHA